MTEIQEENIYHESHVTELSFDSYPFIPHDFSTQNSLQYFSRVKNTQRFNGGYFLHI